MFALTRDSFGRGRERRGVAVDLGVLGPGADVPGRGRFGRRPASFFSRKKAEKGWEGREGREIFFKNLFLKKPPLFRTLQITIHTPNPIKYYSAVK